MNSIFRVIAILFGILFIVSAALQYNDPDPMVWIVIWGVSGLVTLAYAFKRVSFQIPMLVGVAALVGFFYMYPAKFEGFEIGAGDIKNIEEAREAFGLLIIAIVMLVLVIQGYMNSKSKV